MIRFGIAGYGVVGKKRAEALKKNKSAKLVAVCDRNFTSKFGHINKDIAFFQKYNDLINYDLDAIIICLTNDIAAEVTISCLKKNLHVFCEKPPATSLNQLKKVIMIKKNKPNLKLKYGFNHRYHDSIIDAKKIIKSKKLGNIINLKGTYGKSKLITFDQSDWRTKRKIAGGGVLLDQGIHMVDLILSFLNEDIIKIHSFISNNFWKHDVEDNVYTIFKSKKNVICMLNSSATQWKHAFNLEITMEKGSLKLSGILSGSKSYGNEKLIIIKTNHKKDSGNPKEYIKEYNSDKSWEREINEFVKSILNDEQIVYGNYEDAFKSLSLVQRIYYSDISWRKKFKILRPN